MTITTLSMLPTVALEPRSFGLVTPAGEQPPWLPHGYEPDHTPTSYRALASAVSSTSGSTAAYQVQFGLAAPSGWRWS